MIGSRGGGAFLHDRLIRGLSSWSTVEGVLKLHTSSPSLSAEAHDDERTGGGVEVCA